MGIIATNPTTVTFRWRGRSVLVPRVAFQKRGNETEIAAKQRIQAQIEGTDRKVDIDFGSNTGFWQGAPTAHRVPPPNIKITIDPKVIQLLSILA